MDCLMPFLHPTAGKKNRILGAAIEIAFLSMFFLSRVYGVPTPQTSSLSSIVSEPATAGGYQCFRGTNFPGHKNWASFEELTNINLARLSYGNTQETVTSILDDIKQVASQTNPPIDPRIVLAQVMQESQGQISKIGDNGKSIGILQIQMLNGEKGITCHSGTCTSDEILGMIEQGVLGTTRGDGPLEPGIAFYLHRYDVGTALRWYNSGQVRDPTDLSVATEWSTSSYVSDVANRLKGLSPDATFPDPSCGFTPPPWR